MVQQASVLNEYDKKENVYIVDKLTSTSVLLQVLLTLIQLLRVARTTVLLHSTLTTLVLLSALVVLHLTQPVRLRTVSTRLTSPSSLQLSLRVLSLQVSLHIRMVLSAAVLTRVRSI